MLLPQGRKAVCLKIAINLTILNHAVVWRFSNNEGTPNSLPG